MAKETESQYRFELIVSDSISESEPDEVSIIVHNLPPIADSGQDQLIHTIPFVLTLNGENSYDPLGDPISYYWSHVSGH